MDPSIGSSLTEEESSLVAQMVKHLPAMRETWVRSLGWEDLLEKQPTPVLLPGESHGQRSLVGYSPWVAKSRTRLSDLTFTFLPQKEKSNLSPLEVSHF